MARLTARWLRDGGAVGASVGADVSVVPARGIIVLGIAVSYVSIDGEFKWLYLVGASWSWARFAIGTSYRF